MFADLCERIIGLFFSSGATAQTANLSAIRESFVRNMFQAPDLTFWALTGGGLLVLLVLISLIFHLFASKQTFIPAGWISSPKQVRNLLNTAINQRSTFEMQFSDSRSERRPSLRCSPSSLDAATITLEAFGVKSVAKDWEGREVTCYFKIAIKDQPVYYTFSAVISRVDIQLLGVCLLRLNMPEKLQNRQKRAFLRIKPPSEYLMGAAIWHGRRLPSEDKLDDVRLWTKPNLVLLPDKMRQFEINDLSAGGIRLTIPRKELTAANMEFHVAEQVIVLMDVQDPDHGRRVRFWLMCRVQNLALEYNQNTLEMGMQFQAWATPKEGSGANIEWLRLTRDNEVAPLGNWIVRRHLEMFRSSPDGAEEPY